MAKYSVNNHSVDNIISWINSGEIAIPEMQRPFVWATSKVSDLMDSLYKGYPVGYLIIWKNPDVKLKDGTLSSGKFRFRPGDVVYGKINPQLGKCFYASVDGLTSADAYIFNGKNGISQKFLFSLLQTADFFKYSVSVSKRSGMPKINRDEVNAYSFLAPNAEEQNKIGDFLLELDHLITLYQHELEKLQNIKKSMLEKMFV